MSDYADLVKRLRDIASMWTNDPCPSTHAADAIEALQARVEQAEAALAAEREQRVQAETAYANATKLYRQVCERLDAIHAAVQGDPRAGRWRGSSVTEDEDGIHHPDWVARTQAAEAALTAERLGQPNMPDLQAENADLRAQLAAAQHQAAVWGCRDVQQHDEEECPLCRAEAALAAERAAHERTRLERDSAREQFDRHVEWTSEQVHQTEARIAALEAALAAERAGKVETVKLAVEEKQRYVEWLEAALARAEQDRDHWRQEYKTLEGDIQRTVIAQRDELKAALAAEREKSRVLADEKKEAVRLGQLHWEDWDRAEKALTAEREAHKRTLNNLTDEKNNKAVLEDTFRVMRGDRDRWRRKAEQAEAALARADALLRECEWKATAFVIGDDSKTYVAAACPICRRPQPDGHTLDCELAAYLRDREGGAA